MQSSGCKVSRLQQVPMFVFMETLQNHKFHISLFSLLFLLQFSSHQFFSVAYTLPEKYFINCGSDSNAEDNTRNFVGEPSLSFSFSKDSSTEKESNNSSATRPTPLLYQSARIFHGPSSYKFSIDDPGYHLVRLHFFAFSSSINLSTARFNVSVPWFWLLRDFSAQNYSNSPLVKEFFLNINNKSFQIDFRPLESSFAFVNAIELFRLPDNFTQGEAQHVSSRGNTSDYNGLLSWVLETSYRLNVGGPNVSRGQDELWRNWDADDLYATNGTNLSSLINPKYKGDESDSVEGARAATKFIAPYPVYQSARVMNSTSKTPTKSFNITWGLHVKKNAIYLVRAHFLDIVSISLGLSPFNLYIFNNFSQPVDDSLFENSVPFYFDFVVDSDDSGLMTFSIGPDENFSIKNGFLNGLEVMEIINTKGPDPLKELKENHLPLRLVLAFGALALLCIFVVGFFVLLKFRKSKAVETLDWSPLPVIGGGSSHSRRGSSHGSRVPYLNLGLKISFHEIQSATNNFDIKRIIGTGGFGNVYKGVLKNGLRVAVKRRQLGSGQGLPEFQTEIIVLSKIRHRHLVSLIGYCDERSEMILVYEYMEKGTLKDHLYNSNFPSLSWKQRLEICIGAARGLNYLHKGAAGGIIHRDVKSTNILLDENHVAKVADFGLSRTGPLDQQPYVSTGVKGTFGYLDPEYFRSQQLTEKSDVYSFGVVLLEVLCARPAIDTRLPREQANLAEWGIFCKNKGTMEEIIDPSIKGQVDPNSLRKFSETVEKCLQDDGFDRPGMGDVLWDLEYALQLQRGARPREPKDSSSGASASIQLPIVRRLPSLSTLSETSDMPILKDDESDSAVDSVFSQLKIDDVK